MLTFKASYLATLSVGDHDVELEYKDGYSKGKLTIIAATEPEPEPTPEPDPVTYTVSFVMNGHGTAVNSQEVEEGAKASGPEAPKASGYIFGGWYSDKALTERYDFTTAVTADITLYAKWTVNEDEPKEGDDSHTGIWAAMSVISMLGFGYAAISLKKRAI